MVNNSFRYDINSLRALAVIAVVLYHFNKSILPAGFIGVDIFFVISGFLMTKIIYIQFQSGNFSIFDFYSARAKRILPALAVLCFVLIVFGWFFLLPSDYSLLTKHIASSLTFTSNIIYWTESGYFDLAAKEKWLLHTWSLSVEWQFYLAFPIIFFALLRSLKPPTVKLTLVASFIALFAMSVFFTDIKPSIGFYFLPTRAWELLAGSLAFFYPLTLNKKQANTAAFFLISILISCLFLLSDEVIWPSFLTLIPVAATAIFIALNINLSVTRSTVVNFFGNISYSLYLWHWPLSVYLVFSGTHKQQFSVLIAISLAIIFAYLSYRFIETPYRLTKRKFYKLFIGYLLILLLALAVYLTNGAITSFRNISASDKAEFVTKYKNYKIDPDGYWHKCNTKVHYEKIGQFKVDKSCLKTTSDSIFLWGDSHAGALSPGIRSVLKSDRQFSQLASSGCHPYFPSFKQKHLKNNGKDACNISNKLAFEYIKSTQPNTVILTQAKSFLDYNWEKLTKTLQKMGVKKVILIGPTPQWQPNLVTAIANRHWQNGSGYISDPSLDMQTILVDKKLKEKYNNNQYLIYISLIDILCKKENEISCRAILFKQNNKIPLVFDYGHLTKEGAIAIAESAIKSYIADM